MNPNGNDNNYILTNPNYGFSIENKTNSVEIKDEFWQPIRYPQNYDAIDTNLKNQTVNSGVKKDLVDKNIEVNRILKVNDLNTQSSSNFSNFNNWRPINGNWSLITENIKMMRQTNTSDFCYLTTGLDIWKDYTIQTKIRPLYFAGADQPFGIIARFKDTNNFYYVRMSNANILEIRKKVHGTIISLARKTYPVKCNTWYTLKFVMQGERIECFVDNQKELFAKESKLPFGQIGIFMDGVGAEITDLKVSFF